MHLMLSGHAGIVIAVASVMLSFLNTGGSSDNWSARWWYRLLVLLVGISLLWIVANSRYVEHVTWRVNQLALARWGHITVHDYTRLLRLSGDYVVWDMQVQTGHWLVGQTLAESALASEGILILGIERANADYLGAPRGHTRIEPEDQLILYGKQEALLNLDARERGIVGNMQHVIAVSRQLDVLEDESKLDPAS
jgi:hypothetical protein